MITLFIIFTLLLAMSKKYVFNLILQNCKIYLLCFLNFFRIIISRYRIRIVSDILSMHRYSETEAAGVVRQIASGLEAIHKANIVHRDLKPENCLFLDVRRDSPLKIMDFGLSSVEEFTDPVVGLFGSIDYVSPEALSQGKITTKSDMWSLGVILYILLSGYVDFFFFLSHISVCCPYLSMCNCTT